MQLSKLEYNIYNELKKNKFVVFRIQDMCHVFSMSTMQAYNVMKALKKKNAITVVKNGTYAFNDAHDFVVGTSFHCPSYISFWSALNYYGWSDQTPHRIFLATSKYAKKISSFVYVTLSVKKFFGYIMLGEIVIVEKEKAFIDALLFPKYAGGIREIQECFKKAHKELNIDKLIVYARRVQSKAVVRRLGFLLEQEKDIRAKKLLKYIGSGYERLDPSLPKKNKFIKNSGNLDSDLSRIVKNRRFLSASRTRGSLSLVIDNSKKTTPTKRIIYNKRWLLDINN